jgi:hypothetical protein
MAFDQAHADTINKLLTTQRRVSELLDEVAAIRDLAFRAQGEGMRDALEEIHRRASLLAEGAR